MTTLELRQGSPQWNQLRKRCQEDLYFLAAKVLGFESLLPMTQAQHLAICRFIERRTGIKEIDGAIVQLLQCPRGIGKSVIGSECRPIQNLLINRNFATGVASETATGAKSLISTVQAQFEMNSFLRALFPELIPDLNNTKWAADQFIINRTNPNPANPSMLAVGIGSAVTGKHMGAWVVDDLISDEAMENARSDTWTEIEKANRWIDRLKFLLNDYSTDPILFIGTPWWPGDCYDYIRQKYGRGEEPQRFMWTLELSDGTQQQHEVIRYGDLAELRIPGIKNGQPMFPSKWPMSEMLKMQQDKPWLFQSQIMLNPVADSTTNFKKEWLREYHWEVPGKQLRFKDNDQRVHFERVQAMGTLMSIDPAISDKSSSARSAIVITGSTGKRIFILEAWANRVGPSDLSRKVIDLYKAYKPTRVIIENVGYQMALAEVLRLEANKQGVGTLPIHEYKTGSDQRKPMRIAGLEPFFREGLIYYTPSQTDFFQEYCNFSSDVGSRLVDLLDALSFQRESWEDLAFLGGDKQSKSDDASKRAIARLSERFRRKRRTFGHSSR